MTVATVYVIDKYASCVYVQWNRSVSSIVDL